MKRKIKDGRTIELVKSSYQPNKAELEEDFRLDVPGGTPLEKFKGLTRAMVQRSTCSGLPNPELGGGEILGLNLQAQRPDKGITNNSAQAQSQRRWRGLEVQTDVHWAFNDLGKPGHSARYRLSGDQSTSAGLWIPTNWSRASGALCLIPFLGRCIFTVRREI